MKYEFHVKSLLFLIFQEKPSNFLTIYFFYKSQYFNFLNKRTWLDFIIKKTLFILKNERKCLELLKYLFTNPLKKESKNWEAIIIRVWWRIVHFGKNNFFKFWLLFSCLFAVTCSARLGYVGLKKYFFGCAPFGYLSFYFVYNVMYSIA